MVAEAIAARLGADLGAQGFRAPRDAQSRALEPR